MAPIKRKGPSWLLLLLLLIAALALGGWAIMLALGIVGLSVGFWPSLGAFVLLRFLILPGNRVVKK